MKKLMTTLACVGALAVPVMAAPTASAAGDCLTLGEGNYRLSVRCYNTAPGTQFRIVVQCPEGQRGSLWEDQGHWTTDRWITMQCDNIRLVDIQYR